MSYVPPVKTTKVGRKPRQGGTARLAVVLALSGAGVFALLAHGRAAYGAQASNLPPLNAVATTTAAEPLPAPPAAALTATPPAQATPIAPPALAPTASNDAVAERARARIAAPALIVDLAQTRSGDAARLATVGDGGDAAMAQPTGPGSSTPIARGDGAYGTPASIGALAQAGGAAAAPGSTDTTARDLSADERFAARAGRRESEVSHAYRLTDQDRLVPLGTVIGAVMETALNSDVPGFARAITTRNILSFDGSQVVIPAGSHIVGEYKSGVALGASRIFIIWTRLVRPDGVAIALASPATDDLGGGGLGGKVNRHFFERYGGAVLLSVLTGGLNALTQSVANGSAVVVSSSTDATSLAGEAARGTNIPPTIKTRQGAAVRIFVARDLDFSGVASVP